MFGKKRKRSRSKSANAAMNWIILIVMVMAFLNHYRGNVKDISGALPDSAKDGANKTLVDLKQYKNKILPEPSTLTVQDVKPGEGTAATCGQTAKIAYKATDPEGETLDDSATADEPYAFTLGERKALPAFEQGIIGMKKGGVRKLTAPRTFAYGAEGFSRKGLPSNKTITFEVELLDLTPHLPDPSETSFRYIDARHGLGVAYNCGTTAKLELVVWSIDGTKLYTTEKKPPVEVTAGSSEHFMALEQSLVGMKPGGQRTLIVPPAYQKTLLGKADPLEIPFPKGQTVLVDIESVP